MAKSAPPGRASTALNSPVRKYLTVAEVERLRAAAIKSSRYGHRDATMILLAFRHGLRAAELCDLQWHQVTDLRASARPPDQERDAERASPEGRRNSRPAPPAARMRVIVARLHHRAWRPDDGQGFQHAVRSDRRASADAVQGSSAHAASWLRLRAGERRS